MKRKKLIICLGAAILVFILIIIMIVCLNKNMKADKDDSTWNYDNEMKSQNLDLQDVTSNSDYFIIKKALNNLLDDIKTYEKGSVYTKLDGEVELSSKEKDKYLTNIKSRFSEQYLNQNANGFENLLKIFNDIDSFDIDELMYKDVNTVDRSNFVVKISTYNEETKTLSKNKILLIRFDRTNSTFAITPYLDLEESDYSKLDYSGDTIEIKSYNKYSNVTVTDQEIINEYFSKYKNSLIHNDAEKAFNYLNEEYRNKRFGDISEYVSYIKDDYTNLVSKVLDKYMKEDNDENIRYVCLDSQENKYIFVVKSAAEFELILDDYTIPDEEIEDEYEISSDESKAEYNLDRIVQMINARDYKNLYEHLDDSFKNQKYPTENDFKEYMKTSFKTVYSYENNSTTEENEMYIYKITLTDKEKIQKSIDATIIIKIDDDNEFKFSMSIE